tara:strand:+ start:3763 stop:4179 length:417 start_codon:yes stop_codon:yes gene_type:complete
MNELFESYSYNRVGLAQANVSLKAYILHMTTVIEWNCCILDDKGRYTGNSWADDIGDVMENEVNWCKLHVDDEGRELLMKKEVNLYDIICELLNNKYRYEYECYSDKDAFSVESHHIVFNNPRDSDSDNDSDSDSDSD